MYDAFKQHGLFCYSLPAHKYETGAEYEERVMASLAPSAKFLGPPWAGFVLHQGMLEEIAEKEKFGNVCALLFVDGSHFVCEADNLTSDQVVKAALHHVQSFLDRVPPKICPRCENYMVFGHVECSEAGCVGNLCMSCLSNHMQHACSVHDKLKV